MYKKIKNVHTIDIRLECYYEKKISICEHFFGFGMLLTVFAFYSYRSYKIRNSQPVKSQVNPVDTVKEIRTNTSMKYIVEVYEGVTGVITREESTMPAELAGKTREELEAYFPPHNDQHEGETGKDIPQQKN